MSDWGKSGQRNPLQQMPSFAQRLGFILTSFSAVFIIWVTPMLRKQGIFFAVSPEPEKGQHKSNDMRFRLSIRCVVVFQYKGKNLEQIVQYKGKLCYFTCLKLLKSTFFFGKNLLMNRFLSGKMHFLQMLILDLLRC